MNGEGKEKLASPEGEESGIHADEQQSKENDGAEESGEDGEELDDLSLIHI